MKITELRIGDRVQEIGTRFPMTVVGLYSTLDDLKSGTVNLDFEGNEGICGNVNPKSWRG